MRRVLPNTRRSLSNSTDPFAVEGIARKKESRGDGVGGSRLLGPWRQGSFIKITRRLRPCPSLRMMGGGGRTWGGAGEVGGE